MIKVTALDFQVLKNTILYVFEIQFGAERTWIVRRTYQDFCYLHERLMQTYGSAQVPQFPGPVPPNHEASRKTGVKRNEKLESYLLGVVGRENWQPSGFVVQVSHPDDPSARVSVNSFLFEFLDIDENTGAATPRRKVPQRAAFTARNFGSEPPSPMPRLAGESLARLEEESSSSSWDEACPTTTHQVLPGFDVVKECECITTRIHAEVSGFVVYPKSHIGYLIKSTFYGVSWVVEHRYSEFDVLHKSLRAAYPNAPIASWLSEAKVPRWKKLDEETAVVRQQELTKFLQRVVLCIDSWSPKGLVVAMPVATRDGSLTTVMFNATLFEFLDMTQIADRIPEACLEEVERKRRALPKGIRDGLTHERRMAERQQVLAKLVARRKHLTPIKEKPLKELCQVLEALDDDRDAISVVEHFCSTGTVLQGVDSLNEEKERPRTAEIDYRLPSRSVLIAAIPGVAPTPRAATHFTEPTRSKVGLTASQCAAVAKSIFFNDSRKTALLMIAETVLLDDDGIEEVLDTLHYDWEEMHEGIEAVLLASLA